jgi:hypothetical protein
MLPNKSMKDWATKGIQGYVMLMLEYLRISPSYELARKAKMDKLTASEMKRLPKDFDLVLKTYDEYGDVSTIKFADWWAMAASTSNLRFDRLAKLKKMKNMNLGLLKP